MGINKNQGSTLIELLISLLIFSIIAVSLLQVFKYNIFSTVKREDITVALNLARREIETLKTNYDAGTSTLKDSVVREINGRKWLVRREITANSDIWVHVGSTEYPQDHIVSLYTARTSKLW